MIESQSPGPPHAAGSPLIVALDYGAPEPALALVARLRAVPVAMYKVGLELFTAAGPQLVRTIRAEGHEVFLDLKFHDIPNTVAGAVRAAAGLGVALLNVHAAGGVRMMREAVAAARSVSQATRVIAVTVLTSLEREDLAQAGSSLTSSEQVIRFADMAAVSELDGVVASPQEAASLRSRFARPFLIVTPGIRPAEHGGSDDQKRVATPLRAISDGADYIVVGRPITAAADPVAAAQRIIAEAASAAAAAR